MIEKDKYLAASPVKVDQKELISLSGIGKMIQLDPSSIRSLQAGSYVSQYKGRGMEFDNLGHTILGMIPEILIGVSQPEAVRLIQSYFVKREKDQSILLQI